MVRPVSALVLALTVLSSPLVAQFKPERFTAPAPGELAPSITSTLSGDGVKVAAGAATLEFWWVSALGTTGSGPAAWNQVPEGAIVGALRVTGAFKEIRGKVVKPGVYTLRYALQPQNGDHLGASPFREYLLLSPAAADTDPTALGFDGTVASSKQTIGTSHPAALSIDPPVSASPVLAAYTNEIDLKGVTFEVKTSAGGTLKFGLILVGLIEH
jgi:hypothetical protein